MFRAVLPVFGLVLGCGKPDQSFWAHSGDSPGWPEELARLEFLDDAPSDTPTLDGRPLDPPGGPGITEEIDEPIPQIEMSIEAVLQRTRWGESLGRCQVEVAFRPKEETSDEESEESETVQILLPENPGRCAYTALSPIEWGDPGGTSEDDWALEGTLSGADAIYLHSETETLTLHRQEISGGKVRYELESCAISDFPFGQIFDLEVPDTEGAAIPGFYAEEALAVGVDVRMQEPVVSLEAETLFHRVDAPMHGVWDDLGPAPVVHGERLPADRMIFLRNHEHDEFHPFEALACRPPDVQMTLPAETLQILQVNPNRWTEDFYAAYQVDTVYTTPGFEAPWGQTVFSRSTVSESGEVHLYVAD